MDSRGAVICDPEMRARGLEGVWALGDCAIVPGPGGAPYPPTAQHATRLGEHLATSVVRALDGKGPRTPHLRSLGSLAPLGCRAGVAKVFGVKLAGYPAWFLYRTFYLFRMPGLSRSGQAQLSLIRLSPGVARAARR